MNDRTTAGAAPERGFGGFDYVKIAFLGLAANAIWQSLHIVIIPLLVLDFVADPQKNTYLGLLTFCGLLLGMITQPIIGAVSDRYGFSWGRRRPYILFGSLAAMPLLFGMGFASSYIVLLIIYCLFQLSMNASYGPYQAFIPDMVSRPKRGLASGTKGLMEIIGTIALIYPISLLMDRYHVFQQPAYLNQSLGALVILLAVAIVLTLLLVRERPAKPKSQLSLSRTLLGTFKVDISRNRSFLWFLLSRLLVFVAFTTLQQFALNFLADVTGVANPAEATAKFSILGVLGILVMIWPAGYITDKLGRKPVTITACIVGAAGIGLLCLSQSINTILIASGIIGLAVGAFYSANWALATDLVPKNEEARYLGLVNIATAGGAAIARLIGPVIDLLNRYQPGWGYQAMLLSCILYLIVGGLLMLKVKVEKKG
jgi:MFS family permease